MTFRRLKNIDVGIYNKWNISFNSLFAGKIERCSDVFFFFYEYISFNNNSRNLRWKNKNKKKKRLFYFKSIRIKRAGLSFSVNKKIITVARARIFFLNLNNIIIDWWLVDIFCDIKNWIFVLTNLTILITDNLYFLQSKSKEVKPSFILIIS